MASPAATISDCDEPQEPPRPWFRWTPSSDAHLEFWEAAMLQSCRRPFHRRLVPTPDGHSVNTISFVPPRQASDTAARKTPLLMVHGFGGGVGLWAKNLDALSEHFELHAIDLLGFGRSSRPAFAADAHGLGAEDDLVASLEHWREAVGVDKMVLLGHSFGAYVVGAYALKYPQRVSHLVLADPWGMLPAPDTPPLQHMSVVKRALFKTLVKFNPLATLRVLGPLGPWAVQRMRPDFGAKFADTELPTAIFKYIYHLNAQSPAGESAFVNISQNFRWAKRPLLPRLLDLPDPIPVTVLNGSHSWMDKTSGALLQAVRPSVAVHIVPGAGHHVYSDNADSFNAVVADIAASQSVAAAPAKESSA